MRIATQSRLALSQGAAEADVAGNQGGSLLAARASVRCRGSDAEIPEGSPPYEDPPSSECQGMVWAGPDSACPRPSPAWRQWSHPQHGVG